MTEQLTETVSFSETPYTPGWSSSHTGTSGSDFVGVGDVGDHVDDMDDKLQGWQAGDDEVDDDDLHMIVKVTGSDSASPSTLLA